MKGPSLLAIGRGRPVLTARYQSERYRALVEAVRAGDHVRQTTLVEEGVDATLGGEKAFWLLLRAARRLRLMLPVLEPSWADLEAALALAPDDPIVQRNALTTATALALFTEDLQRVHTIVRQLKRNRRWIWRESNIQGNIALLQVKRGRWRHAYRALTRAIEGMERVSEAERSTMLGTLLGQHAQRAVAAIACGHIDVARQDLAEVARLEAQVAPISTNCAVIALGRAEVALYDGCFQEARSALQAALIAEATGRYLKTWPHFRAEMDLLAARIARAEGKQEAFAHFCAKALKIAREHRLAFTEARIRAVMDGAER